MLDDRHTRNGRAAKQYPEDEIPIMMTVYTRAPEKWLLVDRETGQAYVGNEMGSWDRLDPYIDEEKRPKNDRKL